MEPRGLLGGESRVAANTRTFILGWDPLPPEERDGSYVTVTGDGDDYEVVLYATRWVLLQAAEAVGALVTSLLDSLAREVARRGARYEAVLYAGAYPHLVGTGGVGRLLPDPDGDDNHLDAGEEAGATSGIAAASGVAETVGGAALGARHGLAAAPPGIRLVSDGWEPIGLAAVQDLVQARFGPVDLDRTPVTVEPANSPASGCPACDGKRFGYPAELAESAERMCAPHHTAAMEVIAERHRRSEPSNPKGWATIRAAVIRLEEPHLPDHLREPLVATGIYATPDEAELAQAARAGIELADRLREEPEVIAAIEDDWEVADALTNLPATLAGGGRYEDAVAVGDALAVADPDRALLYAAEAALAMARAGREADARQRVATLLQAHPADAETLLAAGEVMAALGDEEAAEGHYLAVLDRAYDQDDPDAAANAIERLDELRGVEEVDDLGWDR